MADEQVAPEAADDEGVAHTASRMAAPSDLLFLFWVLPCLLVLTAVVANLWTTIEVEFFHAHHGECLITQARMQARWGPVTKQTF